MTTTISASMVKELRDQTGAGMMDCKAALNESGGNLEAAVDWLRKKGLSKAAKKRDGSRPKALSASRSPPPRNCGRGEFRRPTSSPATICSRAWSR